MRNHDLHKRLLIIVMLLLAGVYVQVSYWFLAKYDVCRVINAPVPVENPGKIVKRGTAVNIHVVGEKYKSLRAEVSRQLMNGCVITIASTFSDVPAEKFNYIIAVGIPAWVPPGRYKLRSSYKYEVNPIKSVVYSYDSEYFEVVE
jgi:hypothetical protein